MAIFCFLKTRDTEGKKGLRKRNKRACLLHRSCQAICLFEYGQRECVCVNFYNPTSK